MIPQIIHVSWRDKNILNDESELIQRGLKKLVEMNPNWDLQVSDDDDVDRYLQQNLDAFDYALLKKKHIIEKLDVWRLIKLYKEGGLYTDIDRFYNLPLDNIIKDSIKCVLPTSLDYDFTHDFMMSEPGNPIYLMTLRLNLERRRQGHDSIYYLGPQTYMHGITRCLVNKEIDTNPGKEVFDKLRGLIEKSNFMLTYVEEPPLYNILFRNDNTPKQEHENMKRDFYAKHNMKHWSGQW